MLLAYKSQFVRIRASHFTLGRGHEHELVYDGETVLIPVAGLSRVHLQFSLDDGVLSAVLVGQNSTGLRNLQN